MPIVTTSSRKRKSPKTTYIILAFVLVGIAIAYLVITHKKNDCITSEKPTPVQPVKVSATVLNTGSDIDVPKTEPTKQAPLRSALIIRPSQKGAAQTLPLAKTGTVIRAVAMGKGISTTNVVSRGTVIFKNKTENFIYRYANSARTPSMIMTKFNTDVEEEVRKILETDIVIYEDDDEDTIAIKENVAALKQDLLKAIEEGYNASDVLNEMREDNNTRVRNRFRMQRELNMLVKSNMVDAAVEYFNAANKQLNDDCLPPLVFSEKNLPVEQ